MVAYLGAFVALTAVAWEHGADRVDERRSAAVIAAPGATSVRIPSAVPERERSTSPRPSRDRRPSPAVRARPRASAVPAVVPPPRVRPAPRADRRGAAVRRGGSAPRRDRARTTPTTPAAPAPAPAPAPTVPVTATSAASTTLRSVTAAPAAGGTAEVLHLNFAVRRPDVPGTTEVTVPITVPRAAAPDALRLDVRLDLDAEGGPTARVRVADAEAASRSVTVDGTGAGDGEQAVVVPLPLPAGGVPTIAPPAPFRTAPTTLELPVLSAAPSAARRGSSGPSGR